MSNKLKTNFISLSILQGVNLILPLLTFPFLVKTLGVEKYGLIVFAQAFITYFTLIVEYGFNLSGVREITFYKNFAEKVVRIYNSILIARIVLVVIGFFALSVMIFSFELFKVNWQVYYLTYGMVLGTAIYPVWFFQGMEEMRYITILSLISKSIFTGLIFIIVKSPNDYLWVPALNSLGNLIIGFLSLVIIRLKFKIPFKNQKSKYIRQQFQKGWYIFISRISTVIYTATTTFILGLISNMTIVGYYSISEKVIRIITALFSPYTQTIYPHVIHLVKKSNQETHLFLSKVVRRVLLVSFIFFVISNLLSSQIFVIISPQNSIQTTNIFRLLSPLIIVIPFASILFNVVLLAFKLDKYFFRIYFFGAIINLFLLTIFQTFFQINHITAAIAMLVSEFGVTLLAVILLKKKNIQIFKPI